ncbi:hypothetical protein [Burkholderia sp. BCC1981]|uniref:hypothetical protein n=1 Tax=unclassified Burkholderia TaxID=2613784 RepID=UPI0039F1E098
MQAALRPKRCFLEQNRRLRYAVERKLCREWSPEQVSGWLKNRYADDEAMRVSHETIYRGLFVQARGVLKKELQYPLRTQRKMRHSRSSSTKGAATEEVRMSGKRYAGVAKAAENAGGLAEALRGGVPANAFDAALSRWEAAQLAANASLSALGISLGTRIMGRA